jgi:hypothetical protein
MYWTRLLLSSAIGLFIGMGLMVLLGVDFRDAEGTLALSVVTPTLSLGAGVFSASTAGWLLCPRHQLLHSLLAGAGSFFVGAAILMVLAIVAVLLSQSS